MPPIGDFPCRRYGFGPFTLDTSSRLLSRGHVPVSLSPKEFQTLILLVEADGRALERDAMMASIWPDTTVGDTSLGRNISVLRRHLGADAIKSVSKFGYRFTLPVQVLPPALTAGGGTLNSGFDSFVASQPIEDIPPGERKPALSLDTAEAGETRFDSQEASLIPKGGALHPFPQRQLLWRSVWVLAGITLLGGTVMASVFYGRAGGVAKPPAAAALWDQAGMFALREGTYFKASRSFQEAIRLDPQDPMLHAHLAKAWLELELMALARSEILLAGNRGQIRGLSATDQRYLDAVRAAAVRDFPTAVAEYQAILTPLPEGKQADGLEDLGRAQQQAGDIPGALTSYRQAAALETTNAGVQLRLGLLEGLQRNQALANQYLDRAAELYASSTNIEGAAEVSYQRGNMAYVRADYAEAEKRYHASMDDAVRLGDAQLESRAWGALSTIHRWDGKLDESESSARKEIDISKAAGWEFGYADGVMHLANVAIARRDFPQAKLLLEQALALAKTLHHARLTANAEYSEADLAGQQGDYAGELADARLAEADYESYGSVDGVEDAKLLAVYAEYGEGHLEAARHEAEALLQLAEGTHSDVFVEDTEEEFGDIFTAMDDLPTALIHYRRALAMSKMTGSQPDLKSMGLAACLAGMGRINEAAALLKTLPASAKTDPDFQQRYAEARVALLMAQRKYEDALHVARTAASQRTPLAAVHFHEMMAEADLKLRRNAEAGLEAANLMKLARDTHNDFRLQIAQRLSNEALR